MRLPQRNPIMLNTFHQSSASPYARNKSESTYDNSVNMNTQSVFDSYPMNSNAQRNLFAKQAPKVEYQSLGKSER